MPALPKPMNPRFNMRKIISYLVVALVITTSSSAVQTVAEHLQEISVTVGTDRGTGSGVVFTRTAADGSIVNYVWTAAHVVGSLRTERKVITSDGSEKTVVEFADAKVIKGLYQDSRTIGKLEISAEVIKYSDADDGEDLALLRIRKSGFITDSVAFYLDKAVPSIGTSLLHVGSLLGEMGANSMTTGIISQDGRLINNKVFMQSSCPAFPGSSGGGIFLASDGRYVGMLTRGAGETFTFVVPVRRILAFAKRAKVEWAVDSQIALPSNDDLAKIAIEDVVGLRSNDGRPSGAKN